MPVMNEPATRAPAAVPRHPPDREAAGETLRPNPAYVVSRTYDMLAANPGGARLHPGLLG
jgi:hypothetical protein